MSCKEKEIFSSLLKLQAVLFYIKKIFQNNAFLSFYYRALEMQFHFLFERKRALLGPLVFSWLPQKINYLISIMFQYKKNGEAIMLPITFCSPTDSICIIERLQQHVTNALTCVDPKDFFVPTRQRYIFQPFELRLHIDKKGFFARK